MGVSLSVIWQGCGRDGVEGSLLLQRGHELKCQHRAFCLRGIRVGTTEDLRFQGSQARGARAFCSFLPASHSISVLDDKLHHSLADGVSLSPAGIRNELACFPLVSDPLFE